jgi:hypothetical protein
MRQNSPTNICDFEKFPRGLYPRTPVKRGRRGKEGKRKGKGNEEEDREGEGREKGGEGGDGEGTGMGREGKEGRREETGTTSFRTLPPPLFTTIALAVIHGITALAGLRC